MPNSCCDLHLHTYYSDGRASPAEILHHAYEIGLKTIAITDHDNLNAWSEASNIAGELGIELIPGIELTTRWDQCTSAGRKNGPVQDVDLLGYFFDPQDDRFIEHTKSALEDLRERVTDCCSLLSAAGYPISIYDVLNQNPRYPGAMQVILALWHLDYAVGWNEAYALFASQWPSVRPGSFPIDQAIARVHAAGGVAVLAHPVSVDCGNGWLQGSQLSSLVEMGLDGLEIYHPRLNFAARSHFLSLAKQFPLLVTGGSDEHGWREGFSRLGSELVTYEMVNKLRERARITPK